MVNKFVQNVETKSQTMLHSAPNAALQQQPKAHNNPHINNLYISNPRNPCSLSCP